MRTHDEFLAELESWRGTPYRHGVSVKGQGVDCVRFAVSMCEWLHGRPASADCMPYNFSPQAAFCDRWSAMKVYKWMAERYPHESVYTKTKNQEMPQFLPCDIIVLEHGDDEPCHMMIGGVGREIWHANNWWNGGKVSQTGLTHQMLDRIWSIWRIDLAKELR